MSSSTTTELILLKAINVFYKEFNSLPTTASFAPGRVNLIGKLINNLTCLLFPCLNYFPHLMFILLSLILLLLQPDFICVLII
jgi:hypothetical protein